MKKLSLFLLSLMLLAQGCQRQDQPEKPTRRTIQKSLDTSGMTASQIYSLAKTALMDGDQDRAISLFKAHTRRSDVDPARQASAWLGLASAYEEKGYIRDFVKAQEKVAELLPEDPEAFYTLGLAYVRAIKEEYAIIALKRTFALDEDFLPAYTKLAEIMIQQGKEELSRQYLTRYEIALQRIVNKIRTDPDSQVRMDAVINAGRVRDDKATGALLVALRDPEPLIRKTAASLLGSLGEKDSLTVLREIAAAEGDPGVKNALTQAISMLEAER